MAKSRKQGVTIRMYCQGLGDCFLLTFPPATGTKPVRVLIDCGVLQKTPAEPMKMQAVAENLRKETGGHIDLLIVTHEHWDHVAGFSHAQDIFEKFTFDRVWLSWAENPDDAVAKAVKAELGKRRNALHAALAMARNKLGARGSDSNTDRLHDDIDAAENVLAFFQLAQPVEDAPSQKPKKKPRAAQPASSKKMKLGETMDWLRKKVRPGDFRTPGERLALPRADGVNVYVLGPPKDVAAIRKMNPTGDQGYRHLSERVSLVGALDWMTDSTKSGPPPGPFAAQYGLAVADASADPFFRELYGFSDDPLGDNGLEWRRIDNEWLVGGLSRLALQLDTGVNNTSLALAFELPDGRTLIFPGDAQIGNWLSWDKVQFPTSTTADLLKRAVFYKVGHHGSHNATRKAGGLEAMVSGDLVAMIPTDEKFALTQKPHPWVMPFPDLNDALQTRTYHRILRVDQGKEELDQAAAAGRSTSAERWNEFVSRVKFASEKMIGDDGKKGTRPLYVEYTVPV